MSQNMKPQRFRVILEMANIQRHRMIQEPGILRVSCVRRLDSWQIHPCDMSE